MSFLIGVLDEELADECLIVKDGFSAGYQAHKVYLGRNVTLPTDVNISMTMRFKTMDKLKTFFVFWEEKTLNGAKPFYVKLPLFGDMKHYLVLLDGEITQSFSPTIKISGKFVLYRNRTLDENIPPVIEDMTINVEMDSTSNYVFVPVTDVGDEISYTISTTASHGMVAPAGGGTFYYTPNDGFSGTDTFSVIVTDALGASDTAIVTVNVVDWKSALAFRWGLTDDLQSFIEYSNDTLLDQTVKDDLATLANAVMIYNTDALPQIDYSACTGIASISFDSDGNMIVETVN